MDLNKAADALSNHNEDGQLASMSLPQYIDCSALQQEVQVDPTMSKIVELLKDEKSDPKHYTLVHSILLWK